MASEDRPPVGIKRTDPSGPEKVEPLTAAELRKQAAKAPILVHVHYKQAAMLADALDERDRPPVTSAPRCPKCGSDDIFTRYITTWDRLDHQCRGCRYGWGAPALDAAVNAHLGAHSESPGDEKEA